MKFDSRITLRLSVEDHELIKQAADEERLAVASYVRQVVMAVALERRKQRLDNGVTTVLR